MEEALICPRRGVKKARKSQVHTEHRVSAKSPDDGRSLVSAEHGCTFLNNVLWCQSRVF